MTTRNSYTKNRPNIDGPLISSESVSCVLVYVFRLDVCHTSPQLTSWMCFCLGGCRHTDKRLRKGLEKELKRRRQMEDSLWQMGLRYVDTVVACSSELVKLALFAHTPVFEHLFKKGGDPMNLPNLMSRTGGRSVTVYTHRTYNGKVEAFKKSIFLGRYDQPIESSKSVRGASILCANIEPQILQRAKQKLVELRASEDRINSGMLGACRADRGVVVMLALAPNARCCLLLQTSAALMQRWPPFRVRSQISTARCSNSGTHLIKP